MTKRPYKPEGIPALFPYLIVKDANQSVDFYTKAFGFALSSTPAKDENGKIQHAEMKYGNDVAIMFAPEGAWGSPRKCPMSLGIKPQLSLYVYCEDVDRLYTQAIANGAKSITSPDDSFWGDRYCTLLDLDGHEWMFATNIADHTEKS